jgi:hypothetical protein
MCEDPPEDILLRSAAMPEENLSLSDLLNIEIDPERVKRLIKVLNTDSPDMTDEVFAWLVRQQVRWANIQYTRFLAGTKFTEKDVDDILRNAIDTHTHGGSDPMERLLLEDDIGIDYTEAGMRAMVVKTWYTPSASRNALVQKAVDRHAATRGLRPVQCLGGITLNYSVGGFNPEAVKKCLGYPGMKYVWMPMVDSYHHRQVVYDDWSGHGLSFLDDSRHVIPEMKEILRIIADNELVLAIGHFPYDDVVVLVEEARQRGVDRIELVHPAHIHSKHTIEQMKAQAERGAKMMLSGLGAMAFPLHESGPLYAAQIVKEVGAQNLVYGSDIGQLQNPPHTVMNRWMVKLLLAYGCTRDELTTLFQVTPCELLGLEPPAPTTPDPITDGERFRGYPQADPHAHLRAHGSYAGGVPSTER